MQENVKPTRTSIEPWWRHQMETFSALLAICAGNHRSPVNSPHKGQWRGALMFPLICVWINAWVNNRQAGDLRRNHTHYDVTVVTYRRLHPRCETGKFPWILLWGLHNQSPMIIMFFFLWISKRYLSAIYYFCIRQMSTQFSCDGTSQIWLCFR